MICIGLTGMAIRFTFIESILRMAVKETETEIGTEDLEAQIEAEVLAKVEVEVQKERKAQKERKVQQGIVEAKALLVELEALTKAIDLHVLALSHSLEKD
jgi:hypothetical protein